MLLGSLMESSFKDQRISLEIEELRTENHRLRTELEDLRSVLQTTLGGALCMDPGSPAKKGKSAADRETLDTPALNIPADVSADRVEMANLLKARSYDSVTVMFTDFQGFTQIGEQLSPEQLVEEIDLCFRAFDEITARYPIEKIKTVGDSYLCAGGLPATNNTHAVDVVSAALAFQEFMADLKKRKQAQGLPYFEMRIGIHTGPVVAGVVGLKKSAFDIWGDTVNTASRMETTGEVWKINISESTWNLVKDHFHCTPRGKIAAKNKGEIEMFFVDSKKGV
jgi:adenylate cyclase